MFRAYKFRLEPNVNQTRELAIALETHRRLYNACLEQRKAAYETEKKAIKYTEQSAWFKSERGINPYFAHLNFSSAQATMRRLDKAFQAFFRCVKTGEAPGYPRFKGQDRFDSFTYPSVGDGARIISNKLRLQHVGRVRINLHRSIEGEIKTISVKREGDKWYVVAACQLPNVAVPDVSDKPITGIDVGLESFLTAADGEREASLQPLKKVLRKVRVEQRSLSRKKNGGNSRQKQRIRVRNLYARVANTRRDQHHKIAAKLINRYSAIAVESLNIKGMVKNHRLARAVLDSGWNQFLTILKHKAESAGVKIFEVNASRTSQTCPACGVIAKKTLSQRWHNCECGYSTHRDHAAAQVIFARGVLAGMQPGSLNVGVG
jgi:putative transposase